MSFQERLVFLQLVDMSADENRAGAGGPASPTMNVDHLWVGGSLENGLLRFPTAGE